jgi:hypothetical protein
MMMVWHPRVHVNGNTMIQDYRAILIQNSWNWQVAEVRSIEVAKGAYARGLSFTIVDLAQV